VEQDEKDLSRRLIGTLGNDPSQLSKVVDILGEKEVFRGNYRKIYDTIKRLGGRGSYDWPIILANLSDSLKDVATECMVFCEYSNTIPIAQTLVEFYIRRQIGDFGKEATSRAKSDDAFELVEWAESSIFKLANTVTRKNFVSVGDAALDTLGNIEQSSRGGSVGITTHTLSVDNILGRMGESDLVIVAGRPSSGKTALSLEWALENAKRDVGVGVFSFEMSIHQLLNRLFSKICHINSHRITLGRVTNDELKQIAWATEELKEYPLFLEDCGGISVNELKSKARRLKQEKNVSLVVVDYLQLVGAGRHSSREQEVSYISRTLKATAKEIQTPIIALSQLSRAVEVRGGKPQLSDLRDSGSLEQDADTVIFISSKSNRDETRDIDVAKHRNGPIGETILKFVPEFNEFLEIT